MLFSRFHVKPCELVALSNINFLPDVFTSCISFMAYIAAPETNLYATLQYIIADNRVSSINYYIDISTA